LVKDIFFKLSKSRKKGLNRHGESVNETQLIKMAEEIIDEKSFESLFDPNAFFPSDSTG